MRHALARVAAALLCTVLFAGAAAAQSYPTKPIRFVIPFPAGSATDGLARFLGQRMGDSIGQAVIIDNKPGANGGLAAESVARAAPDGYTIFITTNSTHSANVNLYKSLPYDPVADFTPVARLMRIPMVLVVRPEFPAKTVQEFLAQARAQPGKFTSGSGNTSSLAAGEMLKSMAKIDVLNVTYRGNPQAVVDLLGGRLDFMLADTSTSMGHLTAGTLRPLGVTSATRVRRLPDVPPIADANLPGYEMVAWVGAFLPAKTPAPIVAKLNQEFLKAIGDDTAVEYFDRVGGEPYPSTPEELGQFVLSETAKWAKIVKDAGIEKQ